MLKIKNGNLGIAKWDLEKNELGNGIGTPRQDPLIIKIIIIMITVFTGIDKKYIEQLTCSIYMINYLYNNNNNNNDKN